MRCNILNVVVGNGCKCWCRAAQGWGWERVEEKKKACLVQEPFNNFLWKLKKEIVWGRIAGGGWNEAHMNSRWNSRTGGTQTKLFRNCVCVCVFGLVRLVFMRSFTKLMFSTFPLDFTFFFLLCSPLIVSIPARRESLRNVLSTVLLRFLNYMCSPSLRVIMLLFCFYLL